MKQAIQTSRNILSATTTRNIWKALTIMAIGLSLTIAATLSTEHFVEQKEKDEYSMVCSEIQAKISTRQHAYAQLLRSASAYFAASDTVTRHSWKLFIEQTKIDKNLSGVQGVGFALLIPANQLQKHTERIRGEGFPAYTVKPAGAREIYSSIIYLEPFSDRNLRAFGYDMYSEPVRRKAMETARDLDIASLSGKVLLKQETSTDIQAGTLMYVPVYKKRMPVNNVEQRRAAILGWVYIPFRMNDLMQGTLGRWDLEREDRIHLQVYDNILAGEALLYDSQRADTLNHSDKADRFVTLPIEFNGKRWMLRFTQSTEQSPFYNNRVILILVLGIAISFLLLALSWSLFNTRQQAQLIAEKLTKDLKQSEDRFRILLNSTAEAIYGLDMDGNCTYANTASVELMGYKSSDDLLGKNMHDLIHHAHADGSNFDVHDCQIYMAFQKGEGTHVEDEVLWRADGSSFPAEYWSYPVLINGKTEGAVVTFFDITERKLAKDLLDQTRLNYETFFNTIDDFLFVLDEQGNIIHTNNTVTDRLGYTDDQLMNMSVLMVHPAERRNEAGRIVGEMLAGTASFCPVPLVTDSGELIPVETRVKPGFWNGNPVIFGVSKDVSEIKISEEKFSKAFHSNSALMAISGFEDGVFMDVNECFIRTLGYSRDEIIGKTSVDLRLFADTDLRNEVTEKLKQHLPVREFEIDVISKSGRKITGLFSAELISVGKDLRLLTVMVDISERKQAEEALQSKMAVLEAQGNATLDGILVVGEGQSRLVINQRIIEIFDVPPHLLEEANDEALLKHVTALNRDPEKFLEKVMYLYDHPLETSQNEIELTTGVVLDRYTAPVVGKDGKLYGRIWSFRDITERKKAEEEITRARNDAEAANLAKSEFLSRMSHELRTPMNSILGFAQLFEMGELNPGQKKGINHILRSGKHLLNLINEVLDISRIEAGKFSTSVEPVKLSGVISDAIGMIRQTALEQQINIELLHSPDNHLFVRCDRQRLNQVLLNLLNNAIKYNREAGSVIKIRTELMTARETGITYHRISVIDKGIGISSQDIPKLFKPFERIGLQTTGIEGTGLGLAVVKKLMDAMGGHIGLESMPGEGSTFWIELPHCENLSESYENPGTLAGPDTDKSDRSGTILY
ncbi:MAG: CHASE domain-containing protein, partial [Bacteroidota bacterium]